ncbi:MAG: PAS domain S-box protein, partial [Deltaproteobacteria bacterium]|nr:PAS domain S-box protein [Deltaproteobacteria bacterium]
MMKFKLIDLIDIDKNQSLLNSFCDAVGISAAIIDLEGKVLVGSRWQRICTDFHRVNQRTFEKCVESDTQLANELQQGKRFSIYRCRNGLTDAASPIIIEGNHLANAFVGQFLLEQPDWEFFRRQAVAYGFEAMAYLVALSEVPIVRKKNLPAILDFLTTFAEMVAMMGLEQLRQIEAEESLRESEERYRTIIERSPVGLFIIQDRKFQLINPQFLKLTGYSEDDFLGADSLAFVLPEDRDMVNENIIKMLKEEFSLPFEFRVINKSGEIRWVELTVTSIQYQKRRAVLGYYVDINESKQAREEIAKRQKYLESVVNSAPDAIVTLDASHNIIEWNPGAERIFGYTRDEVVGKDIDDLISLSDIKHELRGLTKKLLSREKVLSHETVRYKKDGTPVNVIVSGSPILIEGELHGVVAVYTDITEVKKLETQL